MPILRLCLLVLALWPAHPLPLAAQQQASFSQWRAQAPTAPVPVRRRALIPDSVRQKVGYQHWKGAAIGAGAGAILGSALAFGVAGGCDDCTVTTWDRAQAALLITGASSAFGFLVGLASPKYVWKPPPAAPDRE